MGSSLSVTNVDVYDLIFTKNIFYAENTGSKLHLNQTIVRDIEIDNAWSAIHVADSAKAILDEVLFEKNYKFESLIHAQDSADVQIMNSLFEENVGRVRAVTETSCSTLPNKLSF